MKVMYDISLISENMHKFQDGNEERQINGFSQSTKHYLLYITITHVTVFFFVMS